MYKYIYKLVNKISKFDQVVGNSSNEKGKIVERRIFEYFSFRDFWDFFSQYPDNISHRYQIYISDINS